MVDLQFQRILEEMDYLDIFESGFRLEYCTEIASVLHVINLWQASNEGNESILALFHSIAFSIINHNGIIMD